MMSTASKIAFFIFTFGFVFNFAETWYFGWNYKALTISEEWCNNISYVLVIIGWLMQCYYTTINPAAR